MSSKTETNDDSGQGDQAMPKAYDPSIVEERLYRQWEDSGYFKPSDGDGEPFVIIMPPPNLTGELHLGHALMDTVEDILIRWHRMRGDPTLWLPGIDHAAIAVHVLMERGLAKEGLTRQDIGREAFLERTWDFVNKSRARIFDQHKRLGASADWSRETFTMDPGPARAVRAAFYDFYQRGLIYRGERMINWCPRCQTALSDLEVDHQEEQGFLWHVRYPIIDDAGEPSGDYITIATTRPETIVADTAIAVHPEDERYRDFIGHKARLPIIGRELIIVGDEAIEREFGTGALKVTPGHDPVDFEIGQRHGLPIVTALNLDGTMNDEAGPYAGMDRFACRDAIVRDLDAQGFLVKTEPYAHSVGHCDRCDAIVEPMISEQWFVAVNKEFAPGRSLAGEALKVVNDGLVQFVPERFTKTYTNWMENLRDWCISRQLWWGHRIPVWYCDECNATIVPPPDVEEPAQCESCGGEHLRQDDDTLDTWFSSGLWPVSTLGWPDDTDDLRRFYPTTVMETGYEIIFFWVARMIMMCLAAMDGRRETLEERIPFRYVYLHGMVRDEHGAKMSKTKGNVVDPLDLVEKYGTDALRFSLITGGGTGQDQRLWEEKVEAGRNFANKLWNAARFVIMQLPEGTRHGPPPLDLRESLPVEDRSVLSRLARLTAEVEQLTRDFQLNEAARHIYDFLWGEYCDWYVEMAKVRLRQEQGTGNEEQGPSPLPVLVHVLETGLRLLHPYMPYVTEELWQRLRPFVAEPPAEMLIVAPYPEADPRWEDPEAETATEIINDVIRTIQSARSVQRLPLGEVLPVRLAPDPETLTVLPKYFASSPGLLLDVADMWHKKPGAIQDVLRNGATFIEARARVQITEIADSFFMTELLPSTAKDEISFGATGVDIRLTLSREHDLDAERARLEKEIAETESYVARLNGKLGNEQFRSRAPAEVVAAAEERLAAAQTRLDGLRRALGELE
jgi:valyl-tRNA synthetase